MREVTVHDIADALRKLPGGSRPPDMFHLVTFKDMANNNIVVEDDMTEAEFFETLLPLAIIEFVPWLYDQAMPVTGDTGTEMHPINNFWPPRIEIIAR